MNNYQRTQRLDAIRQRKEYRKIRRINNAALRAAANCLGLPCEDCPNEWTCKQIAADLDQLRQECDQKC